MDAIPIPASGARKRATWAPIFSTTRGGETLFNDIDFWQKWIDRWQDFRLGQFSLTNMNALIDSLANTVRQEQPREQARWGVAPRGGYQAEVNLIKNWLASRAQFIDTNFLAKP